MFGARITLFTLFGFRVNLDASWILLAILVTWSLAKGLFPALSPGLEGAVYWAMALGGALGLFASIVLHEMAHSLVARHYGIPMAGITLFIFGGVAEMTDEPPSAKAEFRMAMAGPLASLALGMLFYTVFDLGHRAGTGEAFLGVAHYLSMINVLLALFNLLPAFPLDGGRMLRAWMWGRSGDLRQATRRAARTGAFFAGMFVLLGLINVLSGNFIGGLWWFLIGLFLRQAAGASYQQVLARGMFSGQSVERFMTRNTIFVPANLTMAELVEDYIYAHHHSFFPVLDGSGRLLGYISTREVKACPRDQWSLRKVGDGLVPSSAQNTVSPHSDALQALSLMNRSGLSRLLVAQGDKLYGIVTLKDLMALFALKLDLGGM